MKRYISGLLLASFTSLFAAESNYVLFYDPVVKVTSEEKGPESNYLYFDLDNIKDSKKLSSCMIESSSDTNELKNIFCIRKSDMQTMVSKIEGKKSEDGLIIINGVLFEMQPLNLKL